MALGSTTKPDKRAKQLTTRIVRRADDINKRFVLTFADLERELEKAQRSNDEGQINLALTVFLASVMSIIDDATLGSERWMFDQLASIYGFNIYKTFALLPENIIQELIGTLRKIRLPDSMAFSFAVREQQRLVSRIRAIVANGQAAAHITAALTGKSINQALREQAIGKADAYNFRKLLDAATVETLHQEMWLQGQEIFDRKIVVGIPDKDQTQLCQRLNGTVWGWNELIVDPVTGGQRMFPPFIGRPFNPSFHFCRSAIGPHGI